MTSKSIANIIGNQIYFDDNKMATEKKLLFNFFHNQVLGVFRVADNKWHQFGKNKMLDPIWLLAKLDLRVLAWWIKNLNSLFKKWGIECGGLTYFTLPYFFLIRIWGSWSFEIMSFYLFKNYKMANPIWLNRTQVKRKTTKSYTLQPANLAPKEPRTQHLLTIPLKRTKQKTIECV